MAQLAPTRLPEQLPAVFRERDAEREDFLARFLEAFEAVFDGVRAEAALVTSLFAVNPTPTLRERADAGDAILYLDSATGLCVGDVVQIEDVLRPAGVLEPRVEFATIAELRGRPPRDELPLPLPTLAPATAEMTAALRYDHVQGAPARRVGRPVAAAPLAGLGIPEAPGPRLQELTLTSPDALAAAAGDVVRIGRETFEYAQVVRTHGSVLVVTPPLRGIAPAETPVALLEPAPATTPPPALEHAERAGGELVVTAPAFAGRRRLELDALTALTEGDVLELRSRDPARTELVRIVDLPAKVQTGLGIPTLTIGVEPALRFDHESGTEAFVVEPAGRGTRLIAPVAPGVRRLPVAVADPAAAGLQEGAAVRIGEGANADYGHARAVSAAALQLETPLRFDQPAGTVVAADAPAGSETRLTAAVALGTRRLPVAVADPASLGLDAGAQVRIGSGSRADYGVIRSVTLPAFELDPPPARPHARDESVTRLATRSGGTRFLAWLAAAVGLELRPDKGERWNRELVRLVGPLWRWRGTRRGVEEFVAGYVRGEVGPRELPGGLERRGVEVVDASNPMQLGLVSTLGLGLVSTLGYDTVLCGRPNFFWVVVDTEKRSHRMYQPAGIEDLLRATQQALRREKPAHTFYDIRLHANTMQLGLDSVNEVGARLGETALLWDEPLVIAGDEERRG